jgi:serine/threonine-protein kinase
VTCITLLTGKQPTDLFDTYRNTWSWRSHAQINDRFANVLDRMLLPSPSDRFQSAAEAIAALTQKRAQPSAPTPTGNVSPPAPVPAPVSPSGLTKLPAFSAWELLGGAAFTGFEGGLLAIALTSVLQPMAIAVIVSAVVLTILVVAQARRVIEKIDLLIITGITLGLMYLFKGWWTLPFFPNIVVLATFAGLLAIATATVFRLIYTLLSRVAGR